jgi:hypothetical protein
MSHVFVRRAVAAAVVPLALTSLSACGGGDATSAKAPASSSASGSGASASSSAAAPTVPAAGATESAADFVARYRAAFDALTTAHATMTMDVMGGTMKGQGDLDYRGDQPAASMTMGGGMFGSGDLQVRLVDNVMYMDLGSMTGGKYARIPLDDPNNPLGDTFVDSLDPSRAMDTLRTSVKKVEHVGHEPAGEHYHATVDTAAMLKDMGEKVPAGAGMPTTLDYDTWFDDQGRLTKMVVDLGSLGSTTLLLSDFGKQVSIEAPPAGQVTGAPMTMAG